MLIHNNLFKAAVTLPTFIIAFQFFEIDPAVAQVSIERQYRGIAAELVDAGDYYLRPDGTKISMLRKKDVYVSQGDPSKSQRSLQRFKDRYGNRVKQVIKHRLGNANVVRLDNSPATMQRAKSAFKLEPSMLMSLDKSISEMAPIFSGGKSRGDLLLLPKLTVKIADSANVVAVLNRLQSRYGLTVDKQLKISGSVYSLEFSRHRFSYGQQFALVRSVMADADIVWAEPQFFSKPYKTVFNPTSNPLYNQQWHLNNTGIGGSRCDTDCDANNAWDIDVVANQTTGGSGVGAVAGDGMVIAIVDDGVQLDHPDLNIWSNPGEIGDDGIANGLDKENNGIDDDGNGCIDDVHGCDFVNDDANAAGSCGDDGNVGPDGNPSPQPTTVCQTPSGDDIEQDNHGTAVAGIAAAVGDAANPSPDIGVVGTAFRAQVLPVRLVSEFDIDADSSFCNKAAEAMTYAGRYADVINNSWGTDDVNCQALRDAIEDASEGTLMDGMVNISHRANGSPVLFASGNSASGWIKVTVPVSAGEHAYEWRFLRDGSPSLIDDPDIQETVWLDDIVFPDGSIEGFEAFDFSAANTDFTNACVVNLCDTLVCEEGLEVCATFEEENTDLSKVRVGGTKSARLDMTNADCAHSYFHTIKDGPAGQITFWVWVSTITGLGEFDDKFEFLVDGEEQLSFGDIPSAGFVNDGVGFPASLSGEFDMGSPVFPGVIAVGASTSGDLSENSSVDQSAEEKTTYSQFGPELDVVAPSSDQHLGIVTTDRTGVDGYNPNRDIGGADANPDPDYTDDFGGTSASTPMVAGIAAAMLAVNPALSASDVKRQLRQTADKIGRTPFVADGLASSDGIRNDQVGYGRVNMYQAILSADPELAVSVAPAGACNAPELFSYVVASDLILPSYTPQPITGMCPALGAIPEDDELCVPIRSINGNIAVICL